MSLLTMSLMGRRRTRPSQNRSQVLDTITDRLVKEYGIPTLGNQRNATREIFYILLSARTNERLYQRAFARLVDRCPRVEQLATSKFREILTCIKGAGLGRKRAAQLIAVAKRLNSDLGANPNRRLRRMAARDAYDYLTGLPGIGPKSALCVMMCSLDHDVFPVDANVQRVFERVGLLRSGLKHYQAQQLAPKDVPAGRSKELHVGLIEHGRRVCIPVRPRCDACILLDICDRGRTTVKRLAKQEANENGKAIS